MERYLLRRLEKTLILYNLGLSVYGLENLPDLHSARLDNIDYSDKGEKVKRKPGRPASSRNKRIHGRPEAQTSFMAAEGILDQISGIRNIGYDIGNIVLSDNCRTIRIRFKERVETPMAEADFSEHISNALEAAKLQEYAGAIKIKGNKSDRMIKITNNGAKPLHPFMKAYTAFLMGHDPGLESADK
jgi:hypothetical protein